MASLGNECFSGTRENIFQESYFVFVFQVGLDLFMHEDFGGQEVLQGLLLIQKNPNNMTFKLTFYIH